MIGQEKTTKESLRARFVTLPLLVPLACSSTGELQLKQRPENNIGHSAVASLSVEPDGRVEWTEAEYQKEIQSLKQKRANAAQKPDELEHASADSWDATKEGFVDAYKDLYDAYREAVEKFN